MSPNETIVPVDPRFPETLDPAFHEALKEALEQSARGEVIPHEVVWAEIRARLRNASKDNLDKKRSRNI